MSRWSLFVPLSVFAVLTLFLYIGFSLEDPHKLPSAMLDKPFPEFALERLDGAGETTRSALPNTESLVNVWATWCPTCLAEHQKLMQIARDEGLPIVGVNYKDDPAKARVWLQRYGNPYVWNVVDEEGRLGIDLGVYGAPETFLLDAKGVIRFKWVGDVNDRVWRDEFVPRLALLRSGSTNGSGES